MAKPRGIGHPVGNPRLTELTNAGHERRDPRESDDVDSTEPPKIVLEQPALCADAASADNLLRRTLAPARAPQSGWTVWMRVSRGETATKGDGEITDASGAPVAHRNFKDASASCAALARAIGVWATLVLDAEVERAKLAAPSADPNAGPPRGQIDLLAAPLWPAPVVNQPPRPEQFTFLEHPDDKRSIEVGFSAILMGGTGTGALAGPSMFTVIEIGRGVFLRPALAVARTLESLKPTGDVYGTLGIARFDACLRLPGLYLDRRGMQLDACGGADIGFLHFDAQSAAPDAQAATVDARTIPFLAMGPSLGLRGELGNDLSVEIRGVAGLNLIRETFQDQAAGSHVDPPLLGGRAETGLSWRWR